MKISVCDKDLSNREAEAPDEAALLEALSQVRVLSNEANFARGNRMWLVVER
jgi:hypothetical protein